MAINLTELNNIYSKLEELGTGTVNTFFTENEFTGREKAQVISSTVSTMLTVSMQSYLQSLVNDAQIALTETQESELALNGAKDRELKDIQKTQMNKNVDILEIKRFIDDATKSHKIDMSLVQKEIAEGTKQDRIDLAGWQTLTAEENYNYAKEKAIALPQSVDFNNKVKALDSVADLYGNHKLGGGTITSSMWNLPFGIIDQLVNGTTGTVTTTGLTTSE